MKDFPISLSQSIDSTGKFAAAISCMKTLYRTACGARAQAIALNTERKAMRLNPEEILAAQARREEARRAVDRLLQLR